VIRPLLGWLLLCCLIFPASAFQRAPELQLLQAGPVEGMQRGNLSGLARCGEGVLAVSDRQDTHLYLLSGQDGFWQARTQAFTLPEARPTHLPLTLQAGSWLRSLRGQALDFEGISCDAAGNRYLLSESLLSVLLVPRADEGEAAPSARWLNLDQAVYAEGAERGLWQRVNALGEGIAVAPDGNTLWLAAERQARGLVKVERQRDDDWRCPVAGCVLLAERRYLPAEPFGPGILAGGMLPLDFSALSYWKGRLWTLERNEHQICRRHPESGQRERCWSFAGTLLSAPHHYPDAPYGLAEALMLDEHGIFIGLDNNARRRPDGDVRPWIFHFALPADLRRGTADD
jgi:hypothetical protein